MCCIKCRSIVIVLAAKYLLEVDIKKHFIIRLNMFKSNDKDTRTTLNDVAGGTFSPNFEHIQCFIQLIYLLCFFIT